MAPGWCSVCATQHESHADCPGKLIVHSPEMRGRRLVVLAERGLKQTFGVLLARAAGGWRGRIITYPNIPWIIPGGGESMKFFSHSAWEAEQLALGFVRAICNARRFKIERELGGVALPPPQRMKARQPASPRKFKFHLVRFGTSAPTEAGGTYDLSESGLFIMTESPLDSGTRISLQLDIGSRELALIGIVRWMRRSHRNGKAPGMGVALQSPSLDYRRYVRSLKAKQGEKQGAPA